MLSDDKILGLWSEGKARAPSRPVIGGRKVVAFARAVEAAAYERAAQECDGLAHEPIGLDENTCLACADAIRALGEQHD